MNKNESFSWSFQISIEGIIAPIIFPRWGAPVLCIPVNILAIGVE